MSEIIGVNKRTYPAEHDQFNGTTVLVVLVAGDIEDYAAYAGTGSMDWVARHGHKISFEEACCHFPGNQLVREKYRE